MCFFTASSRFRLSFSKCSTVMPSAPQPPALDFTFAQASSSTSSLPTLSIRLNHLFPSPSFRRAASIFSLQTPRCAPQLCHGSSPPCLSLSGTDGGGSSLSPSLEAFVFLSPLAPSALPDFFATMATLTPAGRPLARTSSASRSPAFTTSSFPDPLPPTTTASSTNASVSFASVDDRACAARLRPSPAGSPVCNCRIVFILYFLRLVWFFPLLSTSARGDAVTSSSQPVNGPNWPGSFTPEDGAAPQRTGAGFQPAAARMAAPHR